MGKLWRWVLVVALVLLSIACEIENEQFLMIEEARQNTEQMQAVP